MVVLVLGGLRRRSVDEAEQVPGLRDTGEKLLRELQRLDERLVVGLDLQSVVLERVSRDRDRRRVVEGPHAHDLERALDPRPGGEHELCGGWRDLGDEGDRSGLDVRQESVEQPLWASGVLPGEERLLELGDDPHDALSRDGVDQCLHAPLELPDVDRAGIELCGRRLEHDDLRIHALEGGAGERRLADAVLADEQHRSRRVLLEGGDRDLDELASPTDEQGRWIVERPIPDPADARSVRSARQRSKLGRTSGPRSGSKRSRNASSSSALSSERGRTSCRRRPRRADPALDELRDDVVAERPERRGQHRRDHGVLGVGRERTQQKPVLAHGRTDGVPLRPCDPVGGDVVPLHEGRERHRRDPAVRVATQGHDLVDVGLLVCERRDGVRERGQRLERLDGHVPPVVLELELRGERADVARVVEIVEVEVLVVRVE